MITPTRNDWPYPGSRWWTFDFHTHTPASLDTWWAKSGVDLSPEAWLLRYMEAGIDCVAVTDHNSGAWIDGLKSAYKRMRTDAENGSAPDGFRELTLFPGVELSVQGWVSSLGDSWTGGEYWRHRHPSGASGLRWNKRRQRRVTRKGAGRHRTSSGGVRGHWRYQRMSTDPRDFWSYVTMSHGLFDWMPTPSGKFSMNPESWRWRWWTW